MTSHENEERIVLKKTRFWTRARWR